MHRVEVRRQLAPDDVAAVSDLLAAAARADGHPALGDHQWVDLVEGARAGFAAVVAWDDGRARPVGYAQVSRGARSWAVERVVDPDRRAGGEIARALVGEAVGVVAAEGGGHVHLVVSNPTADDDAVTEANGLSRGRDLFQMRRPLPVGEPFELDTRPFVVGQDEEAWLDVNNRAFHWHPEQGGWDVETLRQREAEPWFDPAGFLLHEQGGRLAGFCWTKVHADHDPPLGEIYVIATDPDFEGRGLGRRLVLAGLDHLASKGLGVGMLYVDAGNERAVGLYRAMGFDVDHVDRVYVGDVSAQGA